MATKMPPKLTNCVVCNKNLRQLRSRKNEQAWGFCSVGIWQTLHQEPITQWSGTKSQNNKVLKTPTSTDFKLCSFHLHEHTSVFQNLYSTRKHIQDHYFSWQYLFVTSCWLTIIQNLAPTADQPPTHTYYQRQLAGSVWIIIHNKYRTQGASVTNPRSKFFVNYY